jgi:iron transport multicopper oxidase
MIEAPLTLQETLTLPPDHLAACRAADVPYAGNAAGNTVDLLDLDGQNEAVAPLPAG